MPVHRRPQLPTGSANSSSGVTVGGNVSYTPEENRDLGDRFEDLLGGDKQGETVESATDRANTQRFSPASLFSRRSRERGADAATTAENKSTDAQNTEQLQSNAHDRGGGLKRTASEAHEEQEKTDSDASTAAKEQDSKVEGKKKQSHDDDSQDGNSDGQSGMPTPDMQVQPQSDVSSPSIEETTDDRDGERLTTEIAHEVASRILVEHSAAGGSTKVQIDLRDDVMPNTKATIEDKDGSLTITLSSGSDETLSMLKEHAEALEKAISDKTGRTAHVEIEANPQASPDIAGGSPASSGDR